MITVTPIGFFSTDHKFPYEARRQASADTDGSFGEIQLLPRQGFEQALEDLESFDYIWILYEFHQNTEWKPMVMPPRGPRIKRGVFATRAPYRPNAIGLSCVRLVKVEGLRVTVEGHDLLDGTPVLDIKPYLAYADAFPHARMGWLENVESGRWKVHFTSHAADQIKWLEEQGLSKLRGFIQAQLEFEPLDCKRKRVDIRTKPHRLSYRTWRVNFTADQATQSVQVESIHSGYSEADLTASEDPYEDKTLHRQYRQQQTLEIQKLQNRFPRA